MFYAPATVPIYFSHAKSFMQLANLSVQAFYHIVVTKALRSISKDKSYESRATLPLSVYQFNNVLSCIPHSTNLITYLFAYSIMLVCAWRRSNVASESTNRFDHTRHPTRGDFTLADDGLRIRQKWAKNLQRQGSSHNILIRGSPTNPYCVVKLYHAMIRHSPTTHQLQPLLVFRDSGKAITAPHLATVWQAAIVKAGLPYLNHSLHCIRKTSATAAANLGATEQEIRDLGLWRSQCYQRYVHTYRASALQSKIAANIKI